MLLTFNNAKTIKGQPLGYLTAILYLAPADTSQKINVCPKATAGCKASCLNTAGRGRFSQVQAGRLRKTVEYVEHRAEFLAEIRKDIRTAQRKAKREGLKLAIRLNGTSDLPSLARKFAKEFPDVQFYDYTKIPKPHSRVLPNYHITFSRSETNEADCIQALNNGVNVAVVFRTKQLPDTYLGFPVVSGDKHDLRFLDQSGVVVGLYAKGRAKKDYTGFVVDTTPAGQIMTNLKKLIYKGKA